MKWLRLIIAALPLVVCGSWTHGLIPADFSKNLASYGACNNSDDSAIFSAFNADALSWQSTHTGLVELVIPPAYNCVPNTNFSFGILNFRVMMYGAILNGAFQLGASTGYPTDNTKVALLQTTIANASTVNLITSGQSSRFSIGQNVLVTGYNQQSGGFPPNMAFFEYHKVLAINGGAITLDTPLTYIYKSTWPVADVSNAYQGGPALLVGLDLTWDVQVEWRGGTINLSSQTSNPGRTIIFRDQVWNGAANPFPGTNKNWLAYNVTATIHSVEIDKFADQMQVQGGHFIKLNFQSGGSSNTMTVNNSIVDTMDGGPNTTLVYSSTIGTWKLGANSYGRSLDAQCYNSTVNAVTFNSVFENNVTAYSISNGLVTIPIATEIPAWASPGTNLFFQGQFDNVGVPFRVSDVTGDATNIYVQTTLPAGWPTLPIGAGTLGVRVHPSPKLTFSNCSGTNQDAADLSTATAGDPVWSHTKRTYSSTLNGAQATAPLWGTLSSVSFNVAVAAAGSLNGMQSSGAATVKTDGTLYRYNPVINTGLTGNRLITPGTPTPVSGTQSGDSALQAPEPVWFSGDVAPFAGSAITGATIVIEASTNQSVVANPQYP